MRYLIVLAAGVLSALALSAAPAAADPFYCDRVGPSPSSASVQCGSTGVCFWEYLGNGLWLEHCYPYCEVYYCG